MAAMYTPNAYADIVTCLARDYLEHHPEHSLHLEGVAAVEELYGGIVAVKIHGRHKNTECRGCVEWAAPKDRDLLPDIPLLIKQLEEDIARNLLGVNG